MLKTGLVSITFRKLPVEEIIKLAQQAGLEGIEWGGDVHVPPGDLETARRVRWLCAKAGLAIPSYGSYYRAGVEGQAPFETLLATAQALQAANIRIWAGNTGAATASPEQWQRVVDDCAQVATLAAGAGISVSLEYHRDTLTDSCAATTRLLTLAQTQNLYTYWQPPVNSRVEQNLLDLVALGDRIRHVHVFHWQPDTNRQPLVEGETAWKRYLQLLAASPRDRYLLLEHVRDDAPEAFLQDARTLKGWVAAQ